MLAIFSCIRYNRNDYIYIGGTKLNKGFLSAAKIREHLAAGTFDAKMQQMYGVYADALGQYRKRISDALTAFISIYGEQPVRVFSVSGRTELGGNHTDHQHGRVLCGGISRDIIAVAAPTDKAVIRVKSEGYPEDTVDLASLSPKKDEAGRSAALIRGTAARFSALGKPVGGFCAYTASDVLKGSGMSSSAAFEVMIGTICNDFFADRAFSQAELAMIAQYAENEFFMKPCGLMDQMACALGGVTAIDFADPAAPEYTQVPLDLAAEGYALCIIDSGADHADLTDEYGAVSAEMKAVAHTLGKDVLRNTDESAFWQALSEIRKQCGDRAVMRAIHFYGDNARVPKQIEALRNGDFNTYLRYVNASGESSAFALQNIYASGQQREQAVAVTIALCRHLLNGTGACRVHGGGFAGTVQAYVPLDQVDAFRVAVDAVLGEGACHVLQIRACGACALWNEDDICC